MKTQDIHSEKVAKIQAKMKSLLAQRNPHEGPISLKYLSNPSNTIRSKSYKKGCKELELGELNNIIKIDPQKCTAIVEPRVTMEELVRATLPFGLIPPVVPEFKGITVGGAIMGGAAESASHRWGGFNDTCQSFEILCGNGDVITASPEENADIFYGIACSYGSIGILLSVEIQLIPAKDFVRLQYHFFSSVAEAIQMLQKLTRASVPPDFLDGIVFSKELAVVIEGSLQNEEDLPKFSLKPVHSEWYYQHAEKMESRCEEIMSLQDYLFRYDRGAFWVGAYLFRPQFLARFIFQGILKLSKSFQRPFSEVEIQKLHSPPRPNIFWRTLSRPLMTSKNLWKLHHLAEEWVQTHAIIQDFCIPEDAACQFLEEVMNEPGTFPLWLCPIKKSSKPQIFAPHFSKSDVINIGIYGLPSYFTSIEEVTKKLEQKTQIFNGRKVFYSRSYYTPEEFWRIYSLEAYDALRAKTSANGVWHEITDKVLSK